jgi:hypothetical protein
VILLFEPNRARWRTGLQSGIAVHLGETIGTLE